jgi:hypothetical protein
LKCGLVVFEELSSYWINVTVLFYALNDGSGVIWASEKDGFRHLYLLLTSLHTAFWHYL